MSGEVATTRARFWRVARKDGVVTGYTDHDRDVIFEGVAFRAASGLTAGAVERSTGLSVDNAEAAGALSDTGITETDIAAGRYDGAEITVWDADWIDPSDRRITFKGTFGEVTRAGGAFRVELRGLSEALNRPRGKVFQPLCQAALGDAACKVDLGSDAHSCEQEVEGCDEGTLVWTTFPSFEAGRFAHGRAVMLDGPAAGLEAAIRRDVTSGDGTRRIELWSALGIAPVPGDRVRLEAGCDKRAATCRKTYANIANFRGFPHIPGEDWLTSYPVTSGRNDGGRLR